MAKKTESKMMDDAVSGALKNFEKVKPEKRAAKKTAPEKEAAAVPATPEKAAEAGEIKQAMLYSAKTKNVKKKAAEEKPAAKAEDNVKTPEGLAHAIAQVLYDKKAFDILILDIEKKTALADYFVLASARSSTAVSALAGHVDDTLGKKHGLAPIRCEGMRDGRWAVIDYGSVIVHIFHEETRAFYQLERLWAEDGELNYFVGK